VHGDLQRATVPLWDNTTLKDLEYVVALEDPPKPAYCRWKKDGGAVLNHKVALCRQAVHNGDALTVTTVNFDRTTQCERILATARAGFPIPTVPLDDRSSPGATSAVEPPPATKTMAVAEPGNVPGWLTSRVATVARVARRRVAVALRVATVALVGRRRQSRVAVSGVATSRVAVSGVATSRVVLVMVVMSPMRRASQCRKVVTSPFRIVAVALEQPSP